MRPHGPPHCAWTTTTDKSGIIPRANNQQEFPSCQINSLGMLVILDAHCPIVKISVHRPSSNRPNGSEVAAFRARRLVYLSKLRPQKTQLTNYVEST